MRKCACGCDQLVFKTFAQGHRLRLPGVAAAVGAAKPKQHPDQHPKWKGGQRIKRGYRLLWRPDHPMAVSGYVMEHRLVMAEHLDRMLSSEEHVHHLNYDRLDNRIENLQIVTRAEHVHVHPRDHRPFSGWVKHGACSDCGTTERRHRGNGLCSSCYERQRRRRLAGAPVDLPAQRGRRITGSSRASGCCPCR